MTTVKIGQVWRDKDKRRGTVIEIINTYEYDSGEVLALVVGTEQERTYNVERLQKRWELVSEKVDAESEHAGDQDLPKIHETREQWLRTAVTKLSEDIFGDDYEVPEVRVSVGWPGGRGPKTNTIGQCWPGDSSADGVGQIFISPVLVDPIAVLETLVHELIHAINHKDGDTGHRTAFKRIADPIGLEGKLTATHAGPELADKLSMVSEELGEYPHAAINVADKPKVQKTYMLKFVSPTEPDFFVRMTASKLEEYGAPRDPWGNEMEQEL